MADLHAVRYIGGQSYQGYDPGADRYITVSDGELVTVSDTKRRQLLTDFPAEWEDLGAMAPVNAAASAANVVDTTTDTGSPARARVPRRRKPRDPEQEK